MNNCSKAKVSKFNNLLFCYDGPLSKSGNDYYGSALNNDLFSRYKVFSDNISIAIRVRTLSDNKTKNGLMEISKEYGVCELPNIKSIKGLLKKRVFNEKLKTAIISSDYVIVRLPSSVGDVAVKYCRKLGKPYMIEMVGCAWDSYWNHGLIGKIFAPFSFFKTKRIVKKSKNVVYVSNYFLQRRYPTDGDSISCSDVVIKTYDEQCVCERIKKIEALKDLKQIVIGTIGGVDVEAKGQKYVIDAISALKKKGFNIKYQLVGGGDPSKLIKRAARKHVEKNIEVLGPKKHDEIFNWLKTIDVYVQPSTQEGLCRSIIEAMSCACPVIASNAGGNSELIDNALVFKKKKTKQVQMLISNLSKDLLVDEARNNYCNSKQYGAELLKNRRSVFYKKVMQELVASR